MKKISLIELKGRPIFEQLQLEEALLRSEEGNFCVINYGSPRAIVMGLSNQPEALLDMAKVKADRIPVIKRFSGGGTVIVDESTLFVTFILAKKDFDLSPFPEPILKWGEQVFADAWNIDGFHLRENDYCIKERKCGGNAQYISKDRFLQHTSFLWDYSQENMQYLLLPTRRPKYRLDKSHDEFLTRLKHQGSTVEGRIEELKKAIVKQLYIEKFDLAGWKAKAHRQATHLI